MLASKRIGFLGAGNMAEALIRGLLESNQVEAGSLWVSDIRPQRLSYLRERYGLGSFPDNPSLVRHCDIVLLCVKPQNMREALRSIREATRPDQTLISIAAGIPISLVMAELQNHARVVRVMPNTPALVLEGVSAICPGPHATPEDLETTRQIFSAVGKVVLVEEALMDAVTALSGSGPAYVFLAMEALREAGMRLGLGEETSHLLVAQTFLGAAKMVTETQEDPAVLRQRVSSPGGTTLAGLEVLEEKGFRDLLAAAVEAAARRARELSLPPSP
jgi:pyrroline-5-carboxylate reductase